MNGQIASLTLVALLIPLAGCIGGDDFDFEPGTGYSPTGKTVHLRMWVVDLARADIYPEFKASLWAFCAEPADPNDEYSAAAIEYREPTGVVEILQSDNTYRLDEDSSGKCSVPGPQLRVHQGDKVIVDFENKHFHPHTIHWHGQFVPWESDGVPGSTQDAVVPPPNGDGIFRYEFEAKRAGTLWYHCHVDTQFHVMQGLYGTIIVEPQDDTYEPKDIDKEYTLVFSNLIRDQVEYIPPAPGEVFDPHAAHKASGGHGCGVSSGFPGCKNPPVDADPDVFLINGVSAPNTFSRDDTLMTITPDERIRIRMLNAGPFTIETIHLHGHDMQVTHKDGNPLGPASFWADTILIGPGERYDVVVEGREDAQGIWVMHTHITSRVTNDGQYPGGMLTKLVYEGFEGDVTPFDGVEMPGGVLPSRPVTIPQDYLDSERLFLPDFSLPVATPATVTWEFPITEPCGVQRLSVDGLVSASNPVFDLLSTIDVSVTDPNGAVIFSGSIGGLAASTDRFAFEIVDKVREQSDGIIVADLVAGNYTVSLGGSAIDAEAHLTAFVDYYPNQDTAVAAAKAYLRPACGEIPADQLTEAGY